MDGIRRKIQAFTNHIRKAGTADVTLLSCIIRDSHHDVAGRFGLTADNCPKHPSNCTDAWIESDLIRGIAYYIMEHNDVSVGCVAIEQASPDVCYLERLSVLPGQRRKGLGRALVTDVLFKAKTLGAREVGIGIIAQYTELKSWYKKIGFIEGETKEFAHLPFNVTLMKYQL
jgi:diamine N-acetyltransferase